MKVYDVNTFYVGDTHSVVADSMAEAERIFKAKYPYVDITVITLHSQYVQVQGLDEQAECKGE